MSLFVERTLDTDFGQIEIAITRAEHISVQGQPVVRGTKFNCHLHFWKQADGSYAVRDQDRPSMSRAWVQGMTVAEANRETPKTYLAKVLAAYAKAINVFMGCNQGLAELAEEQDIEREIGRAEGKLQEAQQKLQEAQDAVNALYAKRKNHQLARVKSSTPKVEAA